MKVLHYFALHPHGARSCSWPLLLSLFIAKALRRGGVLFASAASYSETQFIGLEALFNATDGEQWTLSTGWRDAALGVCGWYGVSCNGSGENVTALTLAGNGLAGNITEAAEFFDVVSLQGVDLSDNALVGPVAQGFGLMQNLEVLDLSRNEFSLLPPKWGSGALSLQHLSLQLNNISG